MVIWILSYYHASQFQSTCHGKSTLILPILPWDPYIVPSTLSMLIIFGFFSEKVCTR